MDSPIRGRTRELTNKVEATIPMNIHNRFDVEVIDSRTGKIRQTAHGENVICSQLWTRLFTPAKYFNYIHYGTGSGTPASTNTSLFTFLGYGTPVSGDDVYAYDSANHVYSYRRKIQLSETTAVGSTLTEVGIGYDTSSSSLCTHAMLKDANGNQISIAKTNTDIINIYASVFVHWSSNYDAYIGFSGGSIMEYLCGTASAPNSRIYFQGIKADSASLPANTTATYNQASKTFTITAARLGANSGNSTSGGFAEISLDGGITFYIDSNWYFPQKIIGEAVGTGDGSTLAFPTSFIYSSDAKIYVDGVEQNDAIAHPGFPATSACGFWNIIKPYDSFGRLCHINVNADVSVPINNPITLYNQYNASCGISTLSFTSGSSASHVKIEMSNDLLSWTIVSSSAGVSYSTTTFSVPSTYQFSKYFRITSLDSSESFITIRSRSSQFIAASGLNLAKSVYLPSAPQSGAVVTADYTPATIAKDANHVFDLTVTIQLGEYTA